jgi:hypothetical protein
MYSRDRCKAVNKVDAKWLFQAGMPNAISRFAEVFDGLDLLF